MTRAAILLVVLAAGYPPAPHLAAQGRVPRKWLFAGVGVGLGVGITAAYSAGNFGTNIGWCTSPQCVGIVSSVGFGVIGYLIGREVDQHYALRYRAAPPLSLRGHSRALRTRATTLSLDRTLLAAHGDDGVELIAASPSLTYLGQRGHGLRDVTGTALNDANQHLLVGTTTGLYLYALSGEAPGTRVLSGEMAAVAPHGNRLAVATASALRVGTVGADSVVWREDSTTAAERVTALRWQGDDLLWVLTESALWAYAVGADDLMLLGRVDLRGSLRRLAVRDTLAAIAAGAEGVYLVHIGDPAQPREVASWSEPRYVYDVALWRDYVAAAAGPEGLYLLQPTVAGLMPIGLERDAGFVSSLAPTLEALYALDRSGGVIRRLEAPSSSRDR